MNLLLNVNPRLNCLQIKVLSKIIKRTLILKKTHPLKSLKNWNVNPFSALNH